MKGKDTARTIIYCQTVKQCSLLFKMFEVELGPSLFHEQINDPSKRLVDMMHSGSPISVKNHVLEQFSDNNNCLRILVATIAYGMGVDCKGVTRVIHFGTSKSVGAYLQESGCCGRDGDQSYALLFYNGITIKAADSEMKDYIKSKTCRRKSLLMHFDAAQQHFPVHHLCCDLSAAACTCGACDMDLDPSFELEECSGNRNDGMRQVSREQRDELQRELAALRKKNLMTREPSCLYDNLPHSLDGIWFRADSSGCEQCRVNFHLF